jgi:hypothetical protein
MDSASSWSWVTITKRERLVEQQHLGPLDQGARERDPLALAARELIGRPLVQARKAHHGERVLDPRSDLRARRAGDPEPIRHVLGHAHVREHRVRLEHHVDRPAVRRHLRHVLAIDHDAARARPLEPGEHAEQRGLAAARRPEQREELVRPDLEAHVVDRDHAAKALGHARDAHDRRPAHAPASAVSVGRCRRIAITVSTMVTAIKSVEAALTSGVAPKRTIE